MDAGLPQAHRLTFPTGSSPLPASLCPISNAAEPFGFGHDFCESVGEPVAAGAPGTVWQRAAKHPSTCWAANSASMTP